MVYDESAQLRVDALFGRNGVPVDNSISGPYRAHT